MSAGPWQEIGTEGEGQLAHPLRSAPSKPRYLQECFKMDRKSLLAILPHPILCLQRQVGRQSFEHSDKAGREEHPNGVTLVLVYTFTFTTEKSCSQIVSM